ncbi:MAG: ABC transporter permease [Deinococcota bacterium]
MLGYLTRRLLAALVTILLAASLVFFALVAIPGDPAEVILGINANPEALAGLRRQLGLDQPAGVRFVNWLAALAQGDLGESINYQRPVAPLIAETLSVSLPLSLGAMVIACALAIPLGVSAALNKGTWLDPTITALSQLGAAVPSFWLGLMLILLFSVQLNWFPAAGYVPWEDGPLRTLRSLLLPTLALGLGQAAVMTRMTRAAMLESLSQDYIRTAKAKGLSRQHVVFGHGLRNALVTLVTIIGLSLAQILINAIIVEQVFSLPGMGSLVLRAIGNRDFPLLQGQIFIYASVIVLLSFIVDVSYSLLDPRIRYS